MRRLRNAFILGPAVVGLMAIVVPFLFIIRDDDITTSKEKMLDMLLGGLRLRLPHADETRSQVGWTAFMVACFRAVESSSSIPSSEQLIHDPVALELFRLSNRNGAPFTARLAFVLLDQLQRWNLKTPLQKYQCWVGVRTRFIDDEIRAAASDNGINQFVIVAAGIDPRAFRLRDFLRSTETTLYELDFERMLEEKRTLFEASGFSYERLFEEGALQHVGVDLTLVGWEDLLLRKGFDPFKPTTWLLEGFTSFLTEPELRAVFETISKLSASKSRLIATWIGSKVLSVNRFATSDPTSLVAPFGWSQKVLKSASSVSEQYGKGECAMNGSLSTYERIKEKN